MGKEVNEYFHDDPIEVAESKRLTSKFSLKTKLTGLALISFLSYTLLGSTYATNIQLGSGRVEYGQGVTQSTACDNSVTITPYATFANASGAGADYKLTSIRVTNLDSGCHGKDLIIKAYDLTSSTPLNLYQTGGSTNYSQIRVYNDNGSFNLQDAGLTSNDLTNISGGFQVNLFNSETPASTAAASSLNVYRLTIESVNHDSSLTLANLPSGSMNFVNDTYGIQYASNSAFNFGTGNFTVDVWAYVTNGSSNSTFFTAGGNVNNAGSFAFWVEGNILKIRKNGLSGDVSVAFDNSWRNSWRHYAAVRNNDNYQIYVDGKLVAQGAHGGASVTHTDPTVGQLAGFPNYYGLLGQIRNLRVVKGSALYSGSTLNTTYFTPQAAPLSKVSGTVLLLLVQKPANATFDSSDYRWVPQNTFTLPTYLAP
ncbi:unannotated protein [freshwater metagenome]|uniref:Unannotated protein n=1 Tax=freshwater metagenome TaxID=449393 RepID=A0A6J6EBP7_9ZZZZ